MTEGHIHIDAVGGVSGDMFVAAVLDAFPKLKARALKCVESLRVPHTSVRIRKHSDELHVGCRFEVKSTSLHGHHHKSHASIKADIRRSALKASAKGIATEIFGILARAEAAVHRVAEDDVTFHELGAWDSIVDIVTAADLIDALSGYSWSIGPLPLGSGRVKTAHGLMPVPAPATLQLLPGFDVIDDGVPGERVTPTGIAILCYLKRHVAAPRAKGTLVRCGIGFGTKTFPDISNILRLMILQTGNPSGPSRPEEEISEVCFEIDDQSSEDLAAALEKIRNSAGVLSVIQLPAFGKKGRMVVQVQILMERRVQEAVIAQCLTETSTLGLRVAPIPRVVLQRSSVRVSHRGTTMNVKIARRPAGGFTAKVENEDMSDVAGYGNRNALRGEIEQLALERRGKDAKRRSRK